MTDVTPLRLLADKILSRCVQVGDCLVWQGATRRDGAGVIWRPPVGISPVHRVIYEAANGPIPDGLVIDHMCHNGSGCKPPCLHRRCCNVEHLRAVTQRVNVLAGDSPSAIAARQVLCKNGHDITDPANHLPSANGKRRCRTCFRAWRNEYHRRTGR